MVDSIDVIWRDIEEWLRDHAPKRSAELMPGASSVDISAAEKHYGTSLPESYKQSLAIHDGYVSLTDYTYVPIKIALEIWSDLKVQLAEGVFKQKQSQAKSLDVIARTWWHAGWIPYAQDGGGNLLCIDTVPGPKGTAGQVLWFEQSTGPGAQGSVSFAAWLGKYRDDLCGGALAVDPEDYIREK